MANATTAIGVVQALEWRWKEAETSPRKVAEQRSQAAGNWQLAMLLTLRGRFDEACLHLDEAQRIDPFSYLQKTARARFFYLSKRFEKALEHLSEPLRLGPIPLGAQLELALVYAEREQYAMARGHAQQTLRCIGADPPILAVIAEIYAKCKDPGAAESVCETSGLLKEYVDLSWYRRARLAAALGRDAAALDMLAAAFSDKEAKFPYIAV